MAHSILLEKLYLIRQLEIFPCFVSDYLKKLFYDPVDTENGLKKRSDNEKDLIWGILSSQLVRNFFG